MKRSQKISDYVPLWINNNDKVNKRQNASPTDVKNPTPTTQTTTQSVEPQINIREINVGQELGRGQHGVTYLATSPARPNETLVLKIIPKQPSSRHESYVRREVEIIKSLKENCKLYSICFVDFQEDGENYYILTAYDDNFIDLDKYLDSLVKPIEHDLLVTIMRNLLHGLKYLHQYGVIHRDIKPGNVLINPDTGQTKIIDFGLSCRTFEVDQKRANLKCLSKISGSPLYMAPQIFFKSETELYPSHIYKSADIWSLGLLFYELLSAGHANPSSSISIPEKRRPNEYQGLRTVEDFEKLLRSMAQRNPPGFSFESIKNHPLLPVVKPMLEMTEPQRATIDQGLNTLAN